MNSSQEFDVLVVGGAAAGCSAAIELLAKGLRVGLLSQHGPITTAFESLSPAATSYLNKLSITVGAEFSDVVAWWGNKEQVRASYPGARVVDRAILASKLRERALIEGVSILKSSKIQNISGGASDWNVSYSLAGENTYKVVKAAYLVDATGSAAWIGRNRGAKRHIFDQLFAVSTQVKCDRTGTWTEGTSEGWWNLCSMDGEGTLSFYSNARAIRASAHNFSGYLNKSRHLVKLVSPMESLTTVRACGSSLLVPCAGAGWVAVGDAASRLQPLTSAGVAKAIGDARAVDQYLGQAPSDVSRIRQSEFLTYLRQLSRTQLRP